MTKQEIIYEYEQILLGKKNNLPKYVFYADKSLCSSQQLSSTRKDNEVCQRNALVIFRYVIEKILQWTPQEAYAYFNYEIAEMLHLTNLLQYVLFPAELSKKTNINYIAHLLYPRIIKVDAKELCIRTYQRILRNRSASFPKEYFDNAEGFERAGVCLQYMINTYIRPKNLCELYDIFGDKEKAIMLLNKYRLTEPCEILFYGDPMMYLYFLAPHHMFYCIRLYDSIYESWE